MTDEARGTLSQSGNSTCVHGVPLKSVYKKPSQCTSQKLVSLFIIGSSWAFMWEATQGPHLIPWLTAHLISLSRHKPTKQQENRSMISQRSAFGNASRALARLFVHPTAL
jgi:hypothetical protein